MATLAILLMLGTLSCSLGLDNGLGRLPGLGWNSDYCTNCSGPLDPSANGYGDEVFVKHIADHMHTVQYQTSRGPRTLQQLGFRYVNMDASWDTPTRGPDGSLVPDPKLWPSGLNHTVSYVHSLGLGFGLYGDRGTMDCARNPGQYGHEEHDGAWLGAHKIDWFKSDACYAKDRNEKNQTHGQQDAIGLYRKMGAAMNASGYPIWFALCGWMPFYAPVGKGLANSARIGPDTGGGWTAVLQNLDNALPVSLDAGPTAGGGYWNDGSLQLTPGMGCHGPNDSPSAASPSDDCMTNRRFETMYSIWSVMAFNILLVGDFAKLNQFVMSTWTRPEVIAVNQDSLGVPAVRIDAEHEPVAEPWQGVETSGASRMQVAECGGEPAEQKWTVDGQTGLVANNITHTCLDLATCKTWITYGACNATQSCGGTTQANKRWKLTEAGQLQTLMPTSTRCATVQSDRSVVLAPCTQPVPSTQQWKWDSASLQLTNGAGLCVTANPADVPGGSKIKQVTMVLGRPLANSSYALLMINNKQTEAAVSCDQACLARLNVTGSQQFAVTNLITGQPHSGPLQAASGSVTANVPGYGASVYLRLDPVHV